MKKHLGLYFAIAALIRLILYGLDLANFEDHVTLATSFSSFLKVKEGIFLLRQKINPFLSAQFHTPLGLVHLFSWIPAPLYFPLFVIVDLISASLLVRIGSCIKNGRLVRKPEQDPHFDVFLVLIYLFNPMTVASCVARTTTTIESLFVLLALFLATRGRRFPCALALAAASYLGAYPALLALPLALMLVRQRSETSPRAPQLLAFAALFLSLFAALQALSALGLTMHFPDLSFSAALRLHMYRCYFDIVTVADLRPNLGTAWYFFTEIFREFRGYYAYAFQHHMLVYIAPLAITFWKRPYLLFTLLLMLTTLFKPYPSFGSLAVMLALYALLTDVIPRLRSGIPIALGLLFSSVLSVIFWHLWIVIGTGNANFFWAATLGINGTQVWLLVDTIWAAKQIKEEEQEAAQSREE